MIQLRNMARLDGNLFQRTRRCDIQRDFAGPQEAQSRERLGRPRGFNRACAMVGTSEACNVTYSTRTSVLWRGAESSFQDEPTSWWKPIFDSDITVVLTDDLSLLLTCEPTKTLAIAQRYFM
jgi:hypothetical protein